MSGCGLNKFDPSLLTNDGGKYSPSIRKLRQHYLNDTKSIPNKIVSTQTKNSQSSIDLISTSLKCDDCQKHDGLFQCCHCNQRLCIRCCNKHYKKVTHELENLHQLSDQLLTKIFHIKTDLERQKKEAIEQCQKWRVDTINTINKAHTLIIQTIHDEYDILNKEYELFVEKEMLNINIGKNQLIKMKKNNLGSLLSSPSSKIIPLINSKKSMEIIKQHIETVSKCIDDKGKFSFQVKLPKFDIDDNLRVDSCFGDNTRSTSAIWNNEEIQPEEILKKESLPSSQTTNDSSDSPSNDTELQSDRHDSTYGTASFSSTNSLHNHYEDSFPVSTNQLKRRHTHTLYPTSFNDNKDTYKSTEHVQLKKEQTGSLEDLSIQIEQSKKNDGIIQRHRTSMQSCEIRRRISGLPVRSSSSLNKDRLSKNYPWFFHRTNSTPSFIQ